MSTFTSNTFYSGTKKLLWKQTIHSLQIHDGFLFAGGSSVDAIAGKVLKQTFFFSHVRAEVDDNYVEHALTSFFFCVHSNWKIFSLTTKAIQGTFSTGFDIQRIAINSDFIFTATKCGIIEVWLKERFTRVASIKMGCGGHAKITSLASDMDGEMLFAGSSDGKIQVRNLAMR